MYGLHSLFDVLVKRHFKAHLSDLYILMFFFGLFCLILMIPLGLFVYFYKKIGPDLIDQVKDLYNEYELFFLCFIYDIVTLFLWLRGVILILYYFTPCHFNLRIFIRIFIRMY